MASIGNVELGNIPRIAVPLSDAEVRRDAPRARDLADLFELRIDMFERHDVTYVVEVCRAARAHGVPLIATVRAAGEGGAASLADELRWAIFAAVAPLVDALDIEFHSALRDRVIALGKQQEKPTIVSHHNFDRTPPDNELIAVIDEAKRSGADIVKLAPTARSIADTDRLLGLLRAHRARQLIIIALGPYGTASRVFFPLAGSLLTYGFLNRAVAPGQLSLTELARELRRYCPDLPCH